MRYLITVFLLAGCHRAELRECRLAIPACNGMVDACRNLLAVCQETGLRLDSCDAELKRLTKPGVAR